MVSFIKWSEGTTIITSSHLVSRIYLTAAAIAGAVFLGKKIQDNEETIKDFVRNKGFKHEVYYYKDNNDKK